jgi:hypothetical protein
MNSKIKEMIAFKAGFNGHDLSNTQMGTCHEQAIENLIELVVEECLDKISLLDTDHLTSAGVVNSARAQIKSHFGV